MTIVSVINYKGGVGKTTLTSNLAADLAMRGYKVLMLDLDPQVNLTFSFICMEEWGGDFQEHSTIKSWFDAFIVNVNEFLYHLTLKKFTTCDIEKVYHFSTFDNEKVYHYASKFRETLVSSIPLVNNSLASRIFALRIQLCKDVQSSYLKRGT